MEESTPITDDVNDADVKSSRKAPNLQTLPNKPNFDILILPDKSSRTESCASLQTQSTLTGAQTNDASRDQSTAILGSQTSMQTSSTSIDKYVNRGETHYDVTKAATAPAMSNMASNKAANHVQARDAAPVANGKPDSRVSRPSSGASSRSAQSNSQQPSRNRNLRQHMSPAMQQRSLPAANGERHHVYSNLNSCLKLCLTQTIF